MTKIYLAGKIKAMDWRHKLVPKLRNEGLDSLGRACTFGYMLPFFDNIALYTGPYFVSCDHSCYHGPGSHGCGNTRGCGYINPISPQQIISNCFSGINLCDLFFCFLNSNDAYGSLAELGYAKALGKKIWIVVDPLFYQFCFYQNYDNLQRKHDLWFLFGMADLFDVRAEKEIKNLFYKKIKLGL